MIFWGGQKIDELTKLRLEGHLVKKLQDINVKGVLSKMLLEQNVYGRFKHEAIVDSNVSNLWHTIPAWASTSRDARVHNIIRNEEHSLQKFDTPTKNCGTSILRRGQCIHPEDNTISVDSS